MWVQEPISALPLLSPKGPGAAGDSFVSAQSDPKSDAHSFDCTAPCLLPAYNEARDRLPEPYWSRRCLFERSSDQIYFARKNSSLTHNQISIWPPEHVQKVSMCD